ncbi:uncharacterized protein LOC131690825 [Topomyia yanbarensis]|uniref:uncharacterized protein LOC131690825 n=1 Tax=Topomyia yanbarensis TaxID=2498891 RepID=UPI00273AFBB5|nr:uncharacterized protein LOC131690825 [Topomyia yanbarensis]XP_058832851.1 uncharacterized protein LOC131690825 [Topomyia yanbarensis]XP_058832852.1 uncharacterized protein LOC131690825 [Topomyia yanbarensis]XP_058832853.1 uncharacterized protein LOC131690825 [Topomyia yanbarensis]XP_058832854.1 uncharacterized protein LOC131690825 [Topomyia yanbarensis]XP_058832855.1 uncharacterized protein LOC131690825 [Topomyia yanbarensis]XP_058832856.1 uncharacterized protein LOC131690825 [Topomyia yan
MTTTIVPSGPPSPQAPAPVVVLRSKIPPASVVDHQNLTPPVVGGVRLAENRTNSPSLKTLHSDLSELLVKNLSLKRGGDNCTEKCPTSGGGLGEDLLTGSSCEPCENSDCDSLNLIQNRKSNRNSLCDTFSSVNKLIKLKRVSSDSSCISGYSKVHCGELHSINPPPQAKFKRVEISVQEFSNEVVVPRKNIIVNQFDQIALDEGDSVPLLCDRELVIRAAGEGEGWQQQRNPVKKEFSTEVVRLESCDSGLDSKVRRRIHHPARSRGGTTLESVEEKLFKRRSLQWPVGLAEWSGTVTTTSTSTIPEEAGDGVGEERKGRTNFRHSWNAPGYDLLLEEERGADSRKDFASIVHNLAGLRSALANGGTHESASLLEPQSPQISGLKPTVITGGGGGGVGQIGRRTATGCAPTSPIVPIAEGPHPVSLGGAVPRKRRLEAFLKSLVGRRPSKEPPPTPPAPPAPPPPHPQLITATNVTAPPLLLSPEIKISKSPSEHNLVEMTRSRLNISTTSLSSVHQKLWSVVPLLKKDVSCNSLAPPKTVPLLGSQPGGLRKCETVLALTSTTQTVEPIKAQNRLRHCVSVATCSRCSSLLSLAAAGSRYSLNLSSGGFVAVGGNIDESSTQPVAGSGKHVGSLLRLTKTSSETSSSTSSPCASSSSPSASRASSGPSSSSSPSSSSRLSVTSRAAMLAPPSPTIVTGNPFMFLPPAGSALNPTVKFTCKLCLGEFRAENLTRISQCGCSFCTECMTAYIEFEISEGAYEVSCPDAMCPAQGIITIGEITSLASSSLVEKHHRYRLNREVELDKFRTWCPRAGCETICLVGQNQSQPSSNSSSDRIVQIQPSSSNLPSPCAVHCPTCREDFCSGCKKAWHPTMSCEENTRRLAADGQTDALGIPFDNDLIKCCPMCAVPIEKDEGCAQMMCKRCKHVFCWYCLASLDDDFLLRHYDKGPCKNKLGHSRASVVWHRAQVIGIFAGFGILLLVASPLLLLAAPCIVCCKCRICSGAAKLEEAEVDYDDAAVTLR